MSRRHLVLLVGLVLALALALGPAPAAASHDGSYCEAYYNDGEGQYAVPVSSAHTEAECAAQAGPNGYGWFPAAATTTTTAAPATTTTTAAPATTTTTAAPATTTTTAAPATTTTTAAPATTAPPTTAPAGPTCANPGPATVEESAACDTATQADKGRAEMLLGLALLVLLQAAALAVGLWR